MSTSSFESEPNQPEPVLGTTLLRRVGAPVVAALAFMGSSGEAKGYTAEGSQTPTPIEAFGAHPTDLAPTDTLAESLDQPSALTPEQYNFAQKVLNRANNGPPEMNVIETGAVVLMPGTKVYKAPMKGATDHIIDSKHAEFWYRYRQFLLPDGLWIAARNIMDTNNHIDGTTRIHWATDPSYYSWVKISQAQKVKGFTHYEPLDETLTKPLKVPHVYAIKPRGDGNMEVAQPHPPQFSDTRWLANFYSDKRSKFKINSMQFAADGAAFRRTSRPVRFEKAKLSH